LLPGLRLAKFAIACLLANRSVSKTILRLITYVSVAAGLGQIMVFGYLYGACPPPVASTITMLSKVLCPNGRRNSY